MRIPFFLRTCHLIARMSSSISSAPVHTTSLLKSVRETQSKLFVILALVAFIVTAMVGVILYCAWKLLGLYRLSANVKRKYDTTRRLVAGKYMNSFVNASVNDVWRNVSLPTVRSILTSNSSSTYDDSVFANNMDDDLTLSSRADIAKNFIARTASCNNDNKRTIQDLLGVSGDNYDNTSQNLPLCPDNATASYGQSSIMSST